MVKRNRFILGFLCLAFALNFTTSHTAIYKKQSSNNTFKKASFFVASGILGLTPMRGLSNIMAGMLSDRVSKENAELVLTGWSAGAFLYYVGGGYIDLNLIPFLWDIATLNQLYSNAYPRK
ncbi:MAG TPA: hypothetical protein QGF02_03125 [Candidatus Babeliales bacterium]|nr:hypothetical protein [Candidatus Babeliales bacterium]